MNLNNPNVNIKKHTQTSVYLSKSGKEVAWEKKMREVDNITDNLGKKADEKIKESVCILLMYKFTTSASCEGHIAKKGEKQYGLPYPWIEIYAPEPKEWRKAKGEKKRQIEQKWTIKNVKQQQKMMNLLEEFYKERKTPFDIRLTLNRIGMFGGFRIQSFGGEITAILNPKKQQLKYYQKEIQEFTRFLKNNYFSE